MVELTTALLGLAGLLVAYWAVDEYRDADDAEEALEGTGRRARQTIESGSRTARVGILGGAGLLATLGMEAAGLLAGLNEILGGFPVVLGHVAGGVLGWLGIQGVLTPVQWGSAFISVTAIALVLRATNDPEEI